MNKELNDRIFYLFVMSTIRIESIYDVALSKLLIDEIDELTLSSPSEDVQNLLGVKQNIDIHEVNITDIDQKVGIQLQGNKNSVKNLERIIVDKLPYVVVHQMSVQKDAIFLATIERVTRKNLVFLDLGETKGILFGLRDQNYRQGNTIVVQVKELPTEPDKLPVCSEQINLSGSYVILERARESNFVRVSRKINGPQRELLHEIGKRVKPDRFGIIMRTSAADAREDVISEEVVNLLEKWESIMAEKKESDNKQVSSGDTIVEISFNKSTKDFLDKIRENLGVQIPSYHSLRSYSMATSYALEFGKYFATPENIEEMSEKLYSMIFKKDYRVNNSTKIHLQQISGIIEEEGLGKITEVSDGEFKFVQTVDKYLAEKDISNYVLFEDDFIEVYMKQGSWTVYYKYFGSDKELIGQRVRIISPLDLIFRGRFRAVDLGVDIYLPAEEGASVDVIKEESMEELVSQGVYSATTAEKISDIVTEVTRKLENSEFPILI